MIENLAQPQSKVLGLVWDRVEDTLRVNLQDVSASECVTKRSILSLAHQLFDPLGLVSPAILYLKILLRNVFLEDINWDTEVRAEVQKSFSLWTQEMPYLDMVRIPRWMACDQLVNNSSSVNISLNVHRFQEIHTFVDASQSAYAAVIFLRTEYMGNVSVKFVMAKSRLAPLKNMTIPRLELMAATVGVRLTSTVQKAFEDPVKTVYWTDSSTVLAWIQRNDNWNVFVSNRIKEIRKGSAPEDWRHCPGEQNPADLPSRGCNPKKVAESRWWEGPLWLANHPSQWPRSSVSFDEERILVERRKTVATATLYSNFRNCEWCLAPLNGNSPINCCKYRDRRWYYRYFSKYDKILRLVATVRRFIRNCRTARELRQVGSFSVEEIEQAEVVVLKFIQKESFCTKDIRLNGLHPFEDQEGLLRIKTKLFERDDDPDFLCPVVLPANHEVVSILIRDNHVKFNHAGTQILLNALRERFWILGGRRTVRAVISKCVVCRRYDGKPLDCPSPPLPPDRVQDADPFGVTGIDFAGPVILKGNQKAWIALFTCAFVRAVHLELVTSLSTEAFLQAFRRFVARRGRPKVVYSDNGTNFVGTKRLLKAVNWDKVCKTAVAERIIWKCNPPTAAWWGGWWERLIGVMKQLLRKVLGRASLNFEEMTTILCDCEAIMNSRPLTYVAEDDKDLVALTPAMFLQGTRGGGVPDLDQVETHHLKKRFQYLMRLRRDLRSRFRSDYLSKLVQRPGKQNRGRKTRELQVGEVVIFGCDNKKRVDWPLAAIEELLPGKDGRVRLVRLKTTTGSFLRPVQKVYPLEVTPNSSTDLD